MENYKMVLPEHLNHYGYLFGGNLLKWVDEVGWIAATLDFPGSNFVTIAMDRVEFRKSVRQGSLLRFQAERQKQGRTSVTYEVLVFNHYLKGGIDELVFTTNITYVCLDGTGATCVLSMPAG